MSERLAAVLAAAVLAIPMAAAQSASGEAESPASPEHAVRLGSREASARQSSVEVHEVGAPPVRPPDRTAQSVSSRVSSEELAEAVESVLGFTHIVFNRYRPEEGDYEVVVLRGPAEMERAIGGATVSRESWMKLLRAAGGH